MKIHSGRPMIFAKDFKLFHNGIAHSSSVSVDHLHITIIMYYHLIYAFLWSPLPGQKICPRINPWVTVHVYDNRYLNIIKHQYALPVWNLLYIHGLICIYIEDLYWHAVLYFSGFCLEERSVLYTLGLICTCIEEQCICMRLILQWVLSER